MSSFPDVLILGGGVIGLSAAYYLAREGARVEVVDKGDFGREASWAGAGIIPPGNPDRARTPYQQLLAHSSSMYPRVTAELRETTGIENGYWQCGGLEWLPTGDEIAVERAWRDEGIEFERLEPEALGKVEPALASVRRAAYFLPHMAQVRNPWHLRALLTWCEPRVKLRPHCAVHGLAREGSRVLAAEVQDGRIAAGQYLVAAGAWTGSFLQSFGCRLDVRPVRGQIVLLNTGTPRLRRILLAGKRYVVPRSDGRVLIGSTEEDVGFDKRTTALAIGQLLSFAQEMDCGLEDAQVEHCWAGLRPGSWDGVPFLGRTPTMDNLYVAAGHFRAGIQLAPITGLVMKELLLGQTTTVPLDAFRPERPPASPSQSAFRS
jgi:glycine oxidase